MSNKKKIYKEFNKELLGTVIIALSIIIGLSLVNLSMGLVGNFIKKISFGLLGFAAYFLPIIIFSIGMIFIKDKYNGYEFRYIFQLILLLIFLSIIFDSKNMNLSSFLDRIRVSKALSKSAKGGGLIGTIFGYFIYKLFGKLGGFIILSTALIINIIIYTDTSIKDILNSLSIKKDKLILALKDYGLDRKVKNSKDNKFEPIINDTTEHKLEIETLKDQDYNNIFQTNQEDVKKNEENIKGIKQAKGNDIDKNKKLDNKDKNLYVYPPIDLLDKPKKLNSQDSREEIQKNARIIEKTMDNFGINASITYINKGPTITCYELDPAPDVKLSKIVSLSDNLALSLASPDIRIEAPIPGKSAVGIEVPNKVKSSVSFKEMILTKEFKDLDSKVPLTLGKDVSGKAIVSSINKMPHLLIAGATGSGKSVCINTIIMSILYKSSPDETKLILIDPKLVELNIYNDIPHLLIPVVTGAKEAALSLRWCVQEMERRYQLFADTSSRNIESYNKNKLGDEKMPNIIIIIDELADLMMVSAKEIEEYISRLAQMARAAGMHLILATQRPSVDVITGTIKANIPSRISFAVSSQVDSRTILDQGGAEKLLGMGDMLFYPSNYSKPVRIQGAFISDEEIERVVDFIISNNKSGYNEQVIERIEKASEVDNLNSDPLTNDAIELIVLSNNASISMLQRELNIGYNRARDIIDDLEKRNIVGGHEGSKARKVLVSKEDLNDIIL